MIAKNNYNGVNFKRQNLGDIDMGRTKEQWEDYCIKHIRENNFQFTVFWATENKFIANAMERLSPCLQTKDIGFPRTSVTKIVRPIKYK
jgi:hypothetical protein